MRTLVLLVVIVTTASAQTSYHFQHLDVKDGLAAEWAGTMVQDSAGFLWIKYHGGLSRYDGYEFKVYKDESDDSIRSPRMSRDGLLLLDRKQNVWTVNNPKLIADHRVTICRYALSIDGFIKYHPDLNAIVTGVGFDHDDSIVWIGTQGQGLAKYNYGKNETAVYTDASLSDVSITAVTDLGEELLLASSRGLWSFNKQKGNFRRPDILDKNRRLLHESDITDIIDGPHYDQDDLWLFADGHLLQLNKSLHITSSFQLPDYIGAVVIHRDRTGIFWIATFDNGLYRYDPRDQSVANFRSEPRDSHGLKSNRMGGVVVDRDGNVWVGTAQFGIAKMRFQDLPFSNYPIGPGIGGTVGYRAGDREFVVICRNITGKRDGNELLSAMIQPGHPEKLEFVKIPTTQPIIGYVGYLWAGKEKFWIGTFDNGVIEFPLDPNTGKIGPASTRHYLHDPGNVNTISSNETYGVWEDPSGELWIGTWSNGLNKIAGNIPYGQAGSVTTYRHRAGDVTSLANDGIAKRFFAEDKHSFWVVTMSGFDFFRDGKFELRFPEEHPNSIHLAGNELFAGTWAGIYEATVVNGHYQFTRDPMINSAAYGFERDEAGNFWITNDMTLTYYNRQEKTVIQFAEAEGLNHTRDWIYEAKDGILVTADVNGVSAFDPTDIHVNRAELMPVLTNLSVNNRPVNVGGNTGIAIDKSISMLDRLDIDYTHNNFSLEFAAMELTAPEKNTYRYKLDGYDKDWIAANWRDRKATYTNLDPGEYTFRLQASNHHGIWSNREKILSIVVLPPPWKTTWAYALYALLGLAALWMARGIVIQRERYRARIRHEHIEVEKLQELDRMKTSFFTNISHEFRTPLQLIKGPAQMLGAKFRNNSTVRGAVTVIEQNTDRLLHLINQLLDLARLESDNVLIREEKIHLNHLLARVAYSFAPAALQKKIDLVITLPPTNYASVIDGEKVEHVLSNLVSNAIKFTKPGGWVRFEATFAVNKSPQLTFVVADSGIGIAEEFLPKIFNRFYQVNDGGARSEAGSGIGLALAKELTELMGGTISVTSRPGEGSAFTVILPLSQLEPTPTLSGQATEEAPAPNAVERVEPATETEDDGLLTNGKKKATILIVEDHEELRKFIMSCMERDFKCLEASDGDTALDIIRNEMPDLVITDVMMPGIDGITLTRKVKGDMRTSHLPIIIVTARADEESRIQGLAMGADDFLVKPFNQDELVLKVRNIQSSREQLRQQVRLQLLQDVQLQQFASLDEQFLTKVRDLIMVHLSDEHLDAAMLSHEVGLSRAQFYRKVTMLTGMPVNELIKSYRLKRAADLLQQRWGPVLQVAYEVGFSNPSYFSKCFREKYGVLPSAFVGEKHG